MHEQHGEPHADIHTLASNAPIRLQVIPYRREDQPSQ